LIIPDAKRGAQASRQNLCQDEDPCAISGRKSGFLDALKGLIEPEEKRNAVTNTFYSKVFGESCPRDRCKILLHGDYPYRYRRDLAAIKQPAQHSCAAGIDPEKEYGYKVLNRFQTPTQNGVRKAAKILGLPPELTKRIPFPGPALATRIVGRGSQKKRLEIVREATDYC